MEKWQWTESIMPWCDQFVAGSDNLEDTVSYAALLFDNTPAPYRVYITDQSGRILFIVKNERRKQ